MGTDALRRRDRHGRVPLQDARDFQAQCPTRAWRALARAAAPARTRQKPAPGALLRALLQPCPRRSRAARGCRRGNLLPAVRHSCHRRGACHEPCGASLLGEAHQPGVRTRSPFLPPRWWAGANEMRVIALIDDQSVVRHILEHLGRQGVPVLLVEQNAFMALHIVDWGYVIETGQIVPRALGRTCWTTMTSSGCIWVKSHEFSGAGAIQGRP